MRNHRALMLALVVLGLILSCGVMESASAQEAMSPTAGETTAAGDVAAKSGKTGIDNLGLVAIVSIVVAGLTIAVGSIAPAIGEGRAVAQALSSIAQQPDSANTITRTLFVGLAMIESTAIYCFVVSMIMLFANPFWNYFIQ